jgi:hypothetical protein
MIFMLKLTAGVRPMRLWLLLLLVENGIQGHGFELGRPLQRIQGQGAGMGDNKDGQTLEVEKIIPLNFGSLFAGSIDTS